MSTATHKLLRAKRLDRLLQQWESTHNKALDAIAEPLTVSPTKPIKGKPLQQLLAGTGVKLNGW